MKKTKLVTTALLLSFAAASAIQADDHVSVSGHYLGMWNRVDNVSMQTGHFDYAANIDLTMQLSENVSGTAQLQTGTGSGETNNLGFAGATPMLTDVNITYTRPTTGCKITFGSFDTPFGPYEGLSNNADTTANDHIFNDLFYSSLANPVGTLNTLGLKGETSYKDFDFTFSLNNGTGENAANSDNSYGTALQVRNSTFIPNSTVGVSAMNSDDRAEIGNNDSDSFKTNYTAYLGHIETALTEDFSVDAYAGSAQYNTSSASDYTATVARVGAKYVWNGITAAAQVSTWSADGALTDPGLRNGADAKQDLQRYQATLSYELEENVWLKATGIYDNYESGEDVNAVVLSVNGAF